MKKQIRIPTILAIIFIIAGVLTTTLFIKKVTNLLLGARPVGFPKNVRITNLSDTKFTVSFITSEPSMGFLNYGPLKSLGKILSDDKDSLSGETKPWTLHYFTVTNLKPETTYYFRVGSEKKTYGPKRNTNHISSSCLDFLEIEKEGEPFVIKTLPSKMLTCRETPLNGEVVTSQKLSAYAVIICLELENILPLSDYVKKNGKWVIPCYNLAQKDRRNFLTKLEDGRKETIYVEGGKDGQTRVINKIGNDNPVPLIALGKESYDFSSQPLIAPLNIPTAGFTSESDLQPTTSSNSLILEFPQGTIADDLPTFRGKGKPNQVLKIEVKSESPLLGTVIIDENGNWSWTPPKNLAKGEHTVTITAIDEYGNQQVITRTFTIAGLNPLLPITSGTQSAQPTATPTSPYVSPTGSLLPTLTSEPEITELPTVTPAENGSLMNTGNEVPLFIILTITIFSFTVGLGKIIFQNNGKK